MFEKIFFQTLSTLHETFNTARSIGGVDKVVIVGYQRVVDCTLFANTTSTGKNGDLIGYTNCIL